MSNNEGKVVGLDYIDMELNDVDKWDGSQTRVDPGHYVVRLDKIEGGQSKSGGPKMGVMFRVEEAIENPDNEKFVGEVIPQSYSLDKTKDVARRRLKSIIEAAGVQLDKRGGFDPKDLINVQIIVEVQKQSYSEVNPLTQAKEQKESTKVLRERHIDELEAVREELKALATAGGNGHSNGRSEDKAPEEKKPPQGSARTNTPPARATRPSR